MFEDDGLSDELNGGIKEKDECEGKSEGYMENVLHQLLKESHSV